MCSFTFFATLFLVCYFPLLVAPLPVRPRRFFLDLYSQPSYNGTNITFGTSNGLASPCFSLNETYTFMPQSYSVNDEFVQVSFYRELECQQTITAYNGSQESIEVGVIKSVRVAKIE
ncbi:hypothetical protein BZG36_00732 [Bifiguratus adelaidae]|uniref:Uncharacterized protein n=1 Tax=Bifiguratus adelaidae TaxID=1938954 RepID=A0A261Y707_9FUNG|nr:hypothetical protein BZG36_00732 [Bifiguratus adelaidae]